MSYTVRDQIVSKVNYHAREIGAMSLIQDVMEDLKLLDVEFWPDIGNGEYVDGKLIDGPYVKLTPRHTPGVVFGMSSEGPTLALVDTTPTLGDAAIALLPKVGKWTKGYNADSNLISVTGHYRGVRIVIQDTPPDTCTVEKVEEEVVVPAQPERTEKRVRYVLKGDCDPLSTARTQQPESVGEEATRNVEGHSD